MGRSIAAADTYRRYAAECMQMSQVHQNDENRAMLVEMAAMWLRLPDFAERSGGAENSSPAV
jgi:hypothetical protein